VGVVDVDWGLGVEWQPSASNIAKADVMRCSEFGLNDDIMSIGSIHNVRVGLDMYVFEKGAEFAVNFKEDSFFGFR